MEKLRVEGDAFERGLQQAKHFGARALADAREALSNLAVMPRLPGWLKGPFATSVMSSMGRLYHSRHARTLREYQGGKFRRGLDGLAEGFQAPASKLYGFAAFEIEAS